MYELNDLKIKVPDQVLEILSVLTNAGFEAFCVGGCVRDSLLGREPEDWDITTSALPEQVKSLFSNCADTGIKHGTVMVLKKGVGYEVTTYRVDGEYKDGRHPENVSFTRSLEEDLNRRDFTINAFAYNPEKGVIDLFNGIKDLNEGVIKAVGNPDERFEEDALRIMRAVRFVAQLGFKIEKETYNAIYSHSENLSKISAERIRVEFEKTLMSQNPKMVNCYKRLNMAQYVIPVYSDKCFDESKNDLYPELGSRSLRLFAFMENLSENEAKELLKKMTYDNKTKDTVALLIRYKNMELPADRLKIKYALNKMGKEIFNLHLMYNEGKYRASLLKKDNLVSSDNPEGEIIKSIRQISEDIIDNNEPFLLSQLNVSGSDLIENGIEPGSEIGGILQRLLEHVMKFPEDNKKEKLLKLL